MSWDHICWMWIEIKRTHVLHIHPRLLFSCPKSYPCINHLSLKQHLTISHFPTNRSHAFIQIYWGIRIQQEARSKTMMNNKKERCTMRKQHTTLVTLHMMAPKLGDTLVPLTDTIIISFIFIHYFIQNTPHMKNPK